MSLKRQILRLGLEGAKELVRAAASSAGANLGARLVPAQPDPPPPPKEGRPHGCRSR